MPDAEEKPPSLRVDVHALLATEMVLVEDRLVETIRSREPRLTEIAHYLIDAGGKRVRPLVALLVFRACGGDDPDEIIDVAVALELIHSATLLHDDIIDGGEVRRGRISAYRKYGAADTLVVGDYLFSRAFELCGRFEECIIRWASEACIQLTEGEILQGRYRRNAAVTVADYREIIHRKTAGLFQQGARVAARLAGASAADVERLARSGRAIGMGFQVIDDLLDLAADGSRTGKSVGIDLRDGNPSLPIVLALAEDDFVRRVWQSADATEPEILEALERLRARQALLDGVRSEALGYTRTALEELAGLPESPYRDALEGLVRDLAERAV